MIREATLADLSRLIELGTLFYDIHSETDVDVQQVARFAMSHITAKDRVCLVAGTPISAVMCGIVQPHYLNGKPTAFKTAWYALPDAGGYGRLLLRAFERWARKNGAQRIVLTGRRDRTLTMLTRLNYRRLETVFIKDIPCQKQQFPL